MTYYHQHRIRMCNLQLDLAQIPPAYLRQMALYGALVSQIYPDREVECLLIWTQIMKVSSVPAQRRQEMLEQLAAVPDGT